MKKFFLLFATIVFFGSLLLTSCEVEEEEACETDNVGTVTITNNTGEWWDFDVTYQRDGSDWLTNEEVRINNGSSYTFENIGAGEVAIWATDPSYPWEISQTINLSACQDYTFNATEKCQLFNFADVTVINSTGYYLWVDVYDSNGWIEEIFVSPNGSVNYQAEPGQVKFGSKYEGGTWTFSDFYSVSECEDFEFTWTAGKKAALPEGQKENVQESQKVMKKGSNVDYSNAPAK